MRLDGVRAARFTLETPAGRAEVSLALPGLYNVYNALAAAALATALEVPLEMIVAGLAATRAAFGRAETVTLSVPPPPGAGSLASTRELRIMLVKNPAGANEVLRTLALEPGEHDLLGVLNDHIADGRDVSWIWDADFELLAGRVRRATCSGTRAADLAARLKYAGIDPARIDVREDLADALHAAAADRPERDEHPEAAGQGDRGAGAAASAPLRAADVHGDAGAARAAGGARGGEQRVVVSDRHTVLWHDLECGRYTADMALWRELADDSLGAGDEHGRPGAVLDVGAGSGRVALELARAGHSVTALDLDAELLAALRERAADMPVVTVCADARTFELERRDFALCIAPMQTVQLLGGSDGRVAFLRHARAHLRPGGVLVCAIATGIEPFDCDAGDVGPSPEIVRVDGVSFISRATRVRVGRRVVRIERERAVLAGDASLMQERPEWVRDVIELDQLSVSQLEREGREAGLTASGTRAIAATEEHTASVAVMFGA